MSAIPIVTSGQYGITYYEEPEGYSESWGPDSSECRRRCRVKWSDRIKFRDDMMGFTNANYDPTTGRLVRYMPDQHTWHPGMWAVSMPWSGAKGVPNQDATGRITFDEASASGAVQATGSGDSTGWAIYDVIYRRPNFAIRADADVTSELDRWVLRPRKNGIENLTLNGQSYQWGASGASGTPKVYKADGVMEVTVPADQAGKPLPGDMTKPFPTIQLRYQWLQVPVLPDAKIQAALGAINSVAFDTNYGNWPAQTLFLDTVETEPKQYSNSYFYWEIVFNFIYRPTGWNNIFNRSVSNFLPVVAIAAGEPSVFRLYDFNGLFSFT